MLMETTQIISEEATQPLTFLCGMIVGLVLILIIVIVGYLNRFGNLRTYYRDSNDQQKQELLNDLEELKKINRKICDKTQNNYFRNLNNQIKKAENDITDFYIK